jgi:NAD(P)-dependent dehydrogenase (short-subunit alcohol dehydrogenase family)
MSAPLARSGQVAVVVGAGGELGRATAQRLAADGLTVVAVDRSEAGLAPLPAAIRRELVDPTDPQAAKPLIDRIAAEVGPPHVLVNTIGTFALGDALSVTPETLSTMFEVNLGAALWLSQAVIPHMQQAGSGVIVHVTARPALEPTAGLMAYSLSKAALVHLVRTLDVELHSAGIRVNAVAPEALATERNRAVFPPELLAHAVDPTTVAGIIAYLVSDAADPISGAIVPTYGR